MVNRTELKMTNSTGIVPSSVVHKFARKSLKIAISSVVAFLFFVTSLLVNFVQLVNFIAFQYTFPTVGRHINRHLQDIILTRKCLFQVKNAILRFNFYIMQKRQPFWNGSVEFVFAFFTPTRRRWINLAKNTA